MASDAGLVQYIAEQMAGAGNIRYRKMMGDYCLYCDDKVIGLVCDDQLFLKNTPSASENLKGFPMGCAYEGAKPSYVIDNIDNRDFLANVVRQIAEDLPVPKKKKKK
ncbi:TfoX/Sxy family protein [Anaerotignum sp. MB30-C6]|uniref:TfoX/Sxy family protein n=1 Tax=Anaerotignum sp. MB30-C6 TaxID=3070814 RepID=UPI0027DE43F7|nr:TfoX/Sxy family protein [Anaerotignum sp. MB30-C6]WMI81785.1 TfoX/Sxy family protein [Anaerotignum sp. MB30-C6]